MEAAGVVDEVGPACVRGFQPGDRVMAVRDRFGKLENQLTHQRPRQILTGGGYADLVAVDERLVMRVPDTMELTTVRERFAACTWCPVTRCILR